MAEWSVEFDDCQALSRLLWAMDADIPQEPQPGPTEVIKFLVARVKGLRVEVFANEHPPPHFRVRADGETANYRIEDGTQINGGLARHRHTIKLWHAENRQSLIDAWNKLRPSDCPVGEYRAG